MKTGRLSAPLKHFDLVRVSRLICVPPPYRRVVLSVPTLGFLPLLILFDVFTGIGIIFTAATSAV
jgi:hypothetical protein